MPPCSELSPDLFRRRVYGYHVQYLYVHHACPWRQHPSPLLSAVLIHCEYSAGSAFCGTSAFHWGVAGAAVATVISQGLSVAILCLFRMCRLKDYTRLDFRKIPLSRMDDETRLHQGLPSGIQNAVITVGNLVIQKNINSLALTLCPEWGLPKIEGFGFPSDHEYGHGTPTFVSQNLGARQYHRAKRAPFSAFLFGMITAEVTGLLDLLLHSICTENFGSTQEAITYGTIHAHIVSLFFFLLALFPLRCRCHEGLRLCCANGGNAVFLVRPAYCHHSTPVLPGLSDDFLGLSADMGMQYHPVSDLPVQSRLAASFGLNVCYH